MVDEFHNEPQGKEGQSVKWLHKEELVQYETPVASHPVIEALVKYAKISQISES